MSAFGAHRGRGRSGEIRARWPRGAVRAHPALIARCFVVHLAGDTIRGVELGKDFRDLIELLNRHGVRYLAVGGFAVAVHGRPRYTKDLDLWVEVSTDNAKRIIAALEDFGFASLGLKEADFLDPDVVIQLGYEPNRVDFLTRLTGVDFAEAYPMRVSTKISDLEVPVIDRGSLVANKRALGRPHDLDDAEGLET